MTISPLASSALNWLQRVGQPSSSGTGTSSGSGTSPASDSAPISGPAKLLNQLQQLATANPKQFKQVTSQLAARLQKGSSVAQGLGNTTLAGQLSQLASQFQSASQTGQISSILGQQQTSQTNAISGYGSGSSQTNLLSLLSTAASIF